MPLKRKMKRDLTTIVKFIKNHPSSNDMFNLFMKGPEPEQGFMWTSSEWWSPSQQQALSIVNMKVVELGWGGSSYGLFMKLIQNTIKHLLNNMEKNIYRDNEGKWEDDPRNGMFYRPSF